MGRRDADDAENAHREVVGLQAHAGWSSARSAGAAPQRSARAVPDVRPDNVAVVGEGDEGLPATVTLVEALRPDPDHLFAFHPEAGERLGG